MTTIEIKLPRTKYTLEGNLRAQYRDGVVDAHRWVKKHYGKANQCENDSTHSTTKFEWANLSNDYKLDRSDWKMLCPSCHRKMDFRPAQIEFIRNMSKGRPSVKRRAVIQLNEAGILLNTYNFIYEASNQTGIIRTAILNVLAGRAKTAGGYKWQYADERLAN